MADAHPLMLYNTLTRRKERFEPLDPDNVRMYVCGPTVYDYAHIGNARPVIVFDVLFRLLRHIYGAEHVTYARNITDVDDKINARAAEEGVPIRELTERTAKQFHADIRALGVLMPGDVNKPGEPPVFIEPRATEHIEEMKRLTEALVAKGHAYVADGHVLFDVASMPDYGRLANRSLEEMEAGARVEVAPYKKGPMDFVLWKPSKPGEPAWPSPCGITAAGRPGWHLECSAMSDRWLWEEARGTLSEAGLKQPHMFDIHGGGIDLVFPHHENEIAQSRCAHGTPVMANVWMHNGFLQVEGEKMSKSLGNFVTIHELLRTEKFGGRSWPGGVLRYAMLQTDYKQPIDWTVHRLSESAQELNDWANLLDAAYLELLNSPSLLPEQLSSLVKGIFEPSHSLLDSLCDDLNGPKAVASLRAAYGNASSGDHTSQLQFLNDCAFLGILLPQTYMAYVWQSDWTGTGVFPNSEDLRLRHELKTAIANLDTGRQKEIAAQLLQRGWQAQSRPDGYVQLTAQESTATDERRALSLRVDAAIGARNAARKAKNFKEADRIRDELAAMGIALKDAKDPETGEIKTTWEVAR